MTKKKTAGHGLFQKINNCPPIHDMPFSYRQSRERKVFISWHGRQVMILKGKKAENFLKKIEGQTPDDAQSTMAAVTGFFKRGNERLARLKEKNR